LILRRQSRDHCICGICFSLQNRIQGTKDLLALAEDPEVSSFLLSWQCDSVVDQLSPFFSERKTGERTIASALRPHTAPGRPTTPALGDEHPAEGSKEEDGRSRDASLGRQVQVRLPQILAGSEIDTE